MSINVFSSNLILSLVSFSAMWNQPHLIILDEPTNYLDRESLGALAKAVEEFEGGVVIISHNSEFVSQVCTEEWVMDAGHLTTKGESGWMDRQDDKIVDAPIMTTMTGMFYLFSFSFVFFFFCFLFSIYLLFISISLFFLTQLSSYRCSW